MNPTTIECAVPDFVNVAIAVKTERLDNLSDVDLDPDRMFLEATGEDLKDDAVQVKKECGDEEPGRGVIIYMKEVTMNPTTIECTVPDFVNVKTERLDNLSDVDLDPDRMFLEAAGEDLTDDTDQVKKEFDNGKAKCRRSNVKNAGKSQAKPGPAAKAKFAQRSSMLPMSTKPVKLSSNDSFICDEAHPGDCPIHGKMNLIKDTRVTDGDVLRAEKSLPKGLCISRSQTRGAGRGVLAHDAFFPIGTVFGPYVGEIVPKLSDEDSNCRYCWQILRKGKILHYVDGKDSSRANWMRFVNCSETEEAENLTAFQCKSQIFYRVQQKICPGDELLVWYGDIHRSEIDKESDAKLQSKPAKAFSCTVCQKVFSSRDYLRRHQKCHRDTTGSKRFACEQCNFSTEKSSHYQSHLRVHSGEKPFECDICGKRFSQTCTLKRHKLIHTGELPYSCELCCRRFNQVSHLHRHQLSHAEIKPHVCVKCERCFSEPAHLTKHLLAHTNDKKFKCSVCKFRSNLKSHVTRHEISRHTGKFAHHCPVCGKGFVYPSGMRQHIAKQHRKTLLPEKQD